MNTKLKCKFKAFLAPWDFMEKTIIKSLTSPLRRHLPGRSGLVGHRVPSAVHHNVCPSEESDTSTLLLTRMGSPGCEALYMGPPLLHPHPDPVRPWHHHPHHGDLITEDVKPPRGLLGLPDPPNNNNDGWPGTGVYHHHHHLPVCCEDSSSSSLSPPPWLLKESSLSPPPWILKESSLSPTPWILNKAPELMCPVVHHAQGGAGTPTQELEERCLEQVQSLVVGEVLKDIDTACKLLNITAEPMEWSCVHVQKWLLWTEHLYRLPQVCKVFQELTGKDLCSMTEEEFRQRSSQCGDMLYAHLDIWRSAAGMKERCPQADGKAGAEDPWPEEVSCPPLSQQPIHLWQFLRELLLKPHNYSRSIRWLNKDKGIFKIEDSAHVARLWGIRKNRPAMNYDKLSRSIRQYYKKGIIRKPDVSRRLVYQFVNPV